MMTAIVITVVMAGCVFAATLGWVALRVRRDNHPPRHAFSARETTLTSRRLKRIKRRYLKARRTGEVVVLKRDDAAIDLQVAEFAAQISAWESQRRQS